MVKININLSNRWLYTLIFFGILIILAFGVYPVTGVSHDITELSGLGALATKNSVT